MWSARSPSCFPEALISAALICFRSAARIEPFYLHNLRRSHGCSEEAQGQSQSEEIPGEEIAREEAEEKPGEEAGAQHGGKEEAGGPEEKARHARRTEARSGSRPVARRGPCRRRDALLRPPVRGRG